MLWVLESNLQDFGYQVLIKTLENRGIDFLMTKVVPYKNILLNPNFDTFERTPNKDDNLIFDENQKIFAFGTMGLSRIATERGWSPGSFFNSEFNFEKWSKGFGINNLLNCGAKTMKFSDDLPLDKKLFFVRPCEDNKAFSGQIVTKEQFINWQKVINKNNNPLAKLNNETEILIAPFKEIMKEARMFIFNGKVITGSYYKIGLKVQYKEVLDEDPIVDYTNKIVSNYQPAEAFVIDIALTNEGYSVIEINNINSVGLYHANVAKFVDAVMKL